MKKLLGLVFLFLFMFSFVVLANTIESSTMYFEGSLTDDGDGSYSGVIPMVVDGGYDIYGKEGDTAWFGNDPGTGPVWTSQAIGSNHDGWPACTPDTPDWYQYSLEFNGNAWAVRNHPGATESHPWYDTAYWGSEKPAEGVPMSGGINWDSMFASEDDIGAYIGLGVAEIPGGAASEGGGAQAWDMDWSWGSEVVPLEYLGFAVRIEDLGGGDYGVVLSPASGEIVNEDTGIVYSTIQDAIDGASNGDTINVGDGGYTEDLVIDKKITLVGTGYSSTTTLNGNIVISSDDVIVQGFNINQLSPEVSITLDTSSSDRDDIYILNNQFNMPNSPAVGIYLGNTDNTKVSDVIIDNNIFNGPSDMICNPWKVGGSFATGGMNIEVDDLDFTNNYVDSCSIPVNLQDSNIDDILVDNNLFRNTDGVIYFWAYTGTSPSGVLSDFVFTNNDVDSSNSYGVGIDVNDEFDDSNFGTGNEINYNRFVGIIGAYDFEGVSLTSLGLGYELDAESNWWGDCNGPGGVGPGSGSGVSANVDYDPWLGICIENKTNVSCAYELSDVVIGADLISMEDIISVEFMIDINGDINYHDFDFRNGNYYSYTISSTDINGGDIVIWNVLAKDNFDNNYTNGNKTFFVKNKTTLTLDPTDPDGLNDWYVTEPEFTLTNPDAGDIYYRWDSTGDLSYSLPFGLEDIPNAPPLESAGTLELNYWTDYGGECVETEQAGVFYVDLIPPLIIDEYPEEDSTIYDQNPTIYVLLDDYYESNSGINEATIVMQVDGQSVSPVIGDVSDMSKSLSYDASLTQGTHEVYVSVDDNAGWSNSRTWEFDIDLGQIDYLIIHTPTAGEYNERRQFLNVEASEIVEKIEYMDSNDNNPKWKRLCRNCDVYERIKSFRDGWHDLIVRATSYAGVFVETSVSFLIDSKKPRIHKTEPKRGKFANGIFTIQYTEENIDYIKLFWKESGTPTYQEEELIGCEEGKRKECSIDISSEINAIEGGDLDYYFEISDGINDVVASRVVEELEVDTISPSTIITKPTDITYGRYVEFDIELDEEANLYYRNLLDSSDRYKRLCSRCDEYDQEKRFREGDYKLEIKAEDEAGNINYDYVDFIVDY